MSNLACPENCGIQGHDIFAIVQNTYNMDDVTFAHAMIRELEIETRATKKCIERFKMELFDFKPHERSMEMGYLTLLCAEIPLWIAFIVKDPEIDLATFEHLHPKSVGEIVRHFENNVEKAKKALESVTNDSLSAQFDLKANGKVMFTDTKRVNIETTINHMVHHRGQLTVYMRLNDIPVPSIYGPSADEKGF